MSLFDPVIDLCEHGHHFAKLPDHPHSFEGRPRCPQCMAIGLDAARQELAFDRAVERCFQEACNRFVRAVRNGEESTTFFNAANAIEEMWPHVIAAYRGDEQQRKDVL